MPVKRRVQVRRVLREQNDGLPVVMTLIEETNYVEIDFAIQQQGIVQIHVYNVIDDVMTESVFECAVNLDSDIQRSDRKWLAACLVECQQREIHPKHAVQGHRPRNPRSYLEQGKLAGGVLFHLKKPCTMNREAPQYPHSIVAEARRPGGPAVHRNPVAGSDSLPSATEEHSTLPIGKTIDGVFWAGKILHNDES